MPLFPCFFRQFSEGVLTLSPFLPKIFKAPFVSENNFFFILLRKFSKKMVDLARFSIFNLRCLWRWDMCPILTIDVFYQCNQHFHKKCVFPKNVTFIVFDFSNFLNLRYVPNICQFFCVV